MPVAEVKVEGSPFDCTDLETSLGKMRVVSTAIHA